jgi:LysM repeat protein
MKKNHILFALFFFFSLAAFSQKVIKHKISKGETILALAIKYDVSEKDIYELNPKAKGALLQLKTVLLIPNKKNKSKDKKEVASSKNANSEIHTVESGESLYKIAKKYNITLEKLIELGFDYVLTSGLKSTAVLGLTQLTELVAQANNRIQIIPAAGINENNVTAILQTTKANIIHCSLSEEVPSKMQVNVGPNLGFVNAVSSEIKIRAVKKIITAISHA